MTLIALLSAVATTNAGQSDDLRALLPIAGATVLERQARTLAAHGARQILIEAGATPPDLLAAVERLRDDGLDVAIARAPAELLSAMADADRLVLVADGLVMNDLHLQALTAVPAPAVLTTPDVAEAAQYERLDATTRWAGLAIVGPGTVQALAALPGDWDMVLTMLRMAVQAGARRLPCDPERFRAHDITLITTAAVAADWDARALTRVSLRRDGIGQWWLTAPVARWLGARLLARHGAARALTATSLLLLIVTLPLAYFAPAWAAAGCGLIAGLSDATARFLQSFRGRSERSRAVRLVQRAATVVTLPAAMTLASIGDGPLHSLVGLTTVMLGVTAFALVVMLGRRLQQADGLILDRRWLGDAEAGWVLWLLLSLLGMPLQPVAALLPVLAVGLLLWQTGRSPSHEVPPLV